MVLAVKSSKNSIVELKLIKVAGILESVRINKNFLATVIKSEELMRMFTDFKSSITTTKKKTLKD